MQQDENRTKKNSNFVDASEIRAMFGKRGFSMWKY